MNKFQKQVDDFMKEKGWPYWQPLSILARLFEECGEFAREVNHKDGEKKKKETEKNSSIEDEIGDIIFTLICFANSNNINLDDCFKKSFTKVQARDKNRFKKDLINK
ncbi:MAG: nucleotide pyrophosphohydrolase [Candidatus Liptonbacteria bacterium CG11_big_fil_rev_8_21_14_0_20_35_14]|uniref:Nucleotide pyrophosphohydrolase n=1 Tax=Candidatus Liptonbacteria bacterium CG11_big_fil_rev_8_21_14_0_20_35_14 TaxID=1974634 RepID=A0A2H0N9K5_9BACT|nr:MAG: nucleotide pyrophosphohydrolase [Candidatus Liptonbacteria bacterium CG11_big_fil_rev_8_21_14_0_20_35_14]